MAASLRTTEAPTPELAPVHNSSPVGNAEESDGWRPQGTAWGSPDAQELGDRKPEGPRVEDLGLQSQHPG